MQSTVPFPSKLKGAIQVFRLELPLAAAICVVIGELLALGAVPPLRPAVLGFVCGFFLSASALITNDFFDAEVDRVNAPNRPIPAGILSAQEVLAIGLLAALVGLGAAWALNLQALVFSLVVWALGFVYNWKLKEKGIWGNLVVSTSVAMTFILGGIGVGQVWNGLVWVFGLIVFFFDLADEIAGDAMDAEGDRVRGSRSVAIVHGRRAALRLSAVFFGVVVVLTFVPVIWGGLGIAYLFPVSVLDLVILWFVSKLVRSQSPAEGRRWMRRLYLCGSLGLLAFLIASFLG